MPKSLWDCRRCYWAARNSACFHAMHDFGIRYPLSTWRCLPRLMHDGDSRESNRGKGSFVLLACFGLIVQLHAITAYQIMADLFRCIVICCIWQCLGRCAVVIDSRL